MKTYTIVAGVDGVGKSSFLGALDSARRDLGGIHPNCDKADEYMDTLLNDSCIKRGVSYMGETTLSGNREVLVAKKFREAGYKVCLYYIALDSVEDSLARIQNRVSRGGEGAAIDDVIRCFENRWQNVAEILPYCDEAEFYDNNNGFALSAVYWNGRLRVCVKNEPKWLTELQCYLAGSSENAANAPDVSGHIFSLIDGYRWKENVSAEEQVSAKEVLREACNLRMLPEYERLTALLQPYRWKEAPTPEEQANAFVALQSAQPLLLAILAKKKVVGMSSYPQSRYYSHLHEFKEAVEAQNWNEACRTLQDMIRSYSSDTKVFYNTHIILKERLHAREQLQQFKGSFIRQTML